MAPRFFGAGTALVGVTARVSNQIAMVLVTLVATRALDPAQFGIFGLAAAGVTLIRTLLYSGPFEYLLKSADAEADSSACLTINLAIATLFGVVLVTGGALLQPLFNTSDLAPILAAMAPSNLFAAFTAWQEAHLLRTSRLQSYYLVTIAGEIFAAATAIALLMINWGLWALVAQAYARTLFLGVAYFILQPRTVHRTPTFQNIKLIWVWSMARYGAVFTSFASTYGGDFILGAMVSPAATGLYRAASRIMTAVADLFSQPARTIAMTAMSKRAAAGLGAADYWPRLMMIVTVFGWSALAGLAVVAGDYAPLILGPQWNAAGPIIAVMCFSGAGTVMSAVTGPYLVAANRQGQILKLQLLTTALTLIAIVLLARFGVLVAAAASSAILTLSHLAMLVLAIRVEPEAGGRALRKLMLAGAAAAATAIGAFGAMALIEEAAPLRLPVAVALGIGAWLATIAIVRLEIMDGVRALEP